MNAFENIKDFYKPIQPTVRPANDKISYREIRPTEDKIKDFVYCIWQLKTPKPLNEPFVYRVVSDGCIDIFFEHNRLAENFVMGFCRKYTEFAIGKSFAYIGIRFLPAAFPLLFNISAKALSNDTLNLKDILPEFSHWIESKIYSQQSFKEVANLINLKLNGIIEDKTFVFDQRFFNSLELIFQKHGHLDTEKDLDTGLSPRQLRRVFNYYIGTTPKAFCNVVRFQYILNAKPSVQSLKDNKLYYDVGFFDQAHFIKHFKTFYGITPSEAFR